jgi:uncharacterized protein YdhG (YjbR/CyaY superfamily)
MQSSASTVEDYLSELPDSRREAMETVRQVILQNLPEGYEEVMNWGMITYQVPLERYPKTYNSKPLLYAALASQKQHMSVYLTGIYIHEETRQEFEEKYRATGKRFDVGKSCVRFKKLADLPLPLIGQAVGLLQVEEFIQQTENVHAGRKSAKSEPAQ